MSDVEFNQKKRYICIEYPGFVVNVDKALKTLGGLENISKTYNKPGQRLELRFRPDDVYCKPTCGDRFLTSNILLKIVKRRRKVSKPDEENISYSVKIIGIIDITYRFQSLVDFQYLPMHHKENNEYESLLEKLVPSKVHKSDWLKQDIPLFIPPTIFSRIDSVVDYMYRKEPNQHANLMEERSDNIIGVWRQRRSCFALFVYFEDNEIPTGPVIDAVNNLKIKNFSNELKDRMEKLFQERPIWSKAALLFHSKIPNNKLKFLLPIYAYFFINGPWRSLWVRFGYDPRIDPSAKIYQTLDFRVTQKLFLDKLVINRKRGNSKYSLPNTVNKNFSHIATIKSSTLESENKEESPSFTNNYNESTFSFIPGILPPFRQMFYQMCDIQVPEIQELIKGNNGKETNCTEKDGWCIDNMQAKGRTILARYLKKLLDKESLSSAEKHHSEEPSTSGIQKQNSEELDLDSDQESSDNETLNEILDSLQQ